MPNETPCLRALLAEAAAGRPDAVAIEGAAAALFATLRRTDMRSGIATIIRRLAQLAGRGDQPVSPEGWRALHHAAALLDHGDVAPADVRALDDRLRALGLDVDLRAASAAHEPRPINPN